MGCNDEQNPESPPCPKVDIYKRCSNICNYQRGGRNGWTILWCQSYRIIPRIPQHSTLCRSLHPNETPSLAQHMGRSYRWRHPTTNGLGSSSRTICDPSRRLERALAWRTKYRGLAIGWVVTCMAIPSLHGSILGHQGRVQKRRV